MTLTYILVGQSPVPEPDTIKWARWMETGDRVVFQDQIGASLVSTVFLGVDHNHARRGPPLLFETMIFTDGEAEQFQERCATWLQAERQHRHVVDQVMERSPHDQR